jgi:hypothetical protein
MAYCLFCASSQHGQITLMAHAARSASTQRPFFLLKRKARPLCITP